MFVITRISLKHRERTEIEERCREKQAKLGNLIAEVDRLKERKSTVEAELEDLKSARDKLEKDNQV